MIVMPLMPEEQTASWLALLELYSILPAGWTLIGGQLVHLHCAERGRFPGRGTNDADLSKKDRQRLSRMVTAIDRDRELTLDVVGANLD